MKQLTRLILPFILCCLFVCRTAIVSAVDYDHYTVHDVSTQEKAKFLEKIEFLSTNTEAKGNTFSGFAISEQGTIALLFQGETGAINVYSSNGEFQYGYRFTNGFSTVVVFFEDELLSVIWGKELYIASFDAEGNCVSFGSYVNTKSNADAYHHDRYPPTSGQAGNLQYSVKRIGLSPEYSRFTVADGTGSKLVIYDATKETRIRQAFIGVSAISVVLIILLIKRKNKEAEYYYTDRENPET